MSQASRDARITVRYAETDQMGVAYYANYLVWMEVARVEYCRAIGFRYKDMEAEDGVLLAVVEAHCRYRHPAHYDDEVIIRTWIEQATARLVRFGYEMRRAADGRILASGETRHIFCNREMRPVRLPAKYLALFGVARNVAGGRGI
jgi:acyl-CoA thioester hydrolase